MTTTDDGRFVAIEPGADRLEQMIRELLGLLRAQQEAATTILT
jgi:hypothetical protein